jgi:transposase
MFAVLTYANMRGVRAIDRIVDLCERDIAFIWLTKGLKPKRDAFYDYIKNKLDDEVLDNLHYQFIHLLQKAGLITLEALFIDGTKIEANANRYTFVWRGTINYHLSGLIETIESLYNRYNALIKL